jgi:hypothetical protein
MRYRIAPPTTSAARRWSAWLEEETLTVHVQATYELGQAGEALTTLGTIHTQGKLAIRVA